MVTSEEIFDGLGDLALRILTLEDELARVKKKRDQLVATAVEMSLPRDEIAWASNLSRQRVHSIAQTNRNS
ncbi:hypothetical protein ACUY3S_11255 [Corynebacterium resistens]